jgi:hypothetical protein
MRTNTRKAILFIMLVLFVLFAPTLIFYSQGYRIDLKNRSVTQTGGLFLKTQPKKTEAFIGGKLRGETDFFFGSVLIENLLPEKYSAEVKKEGYHSWKKTVEIKPKEVTEFKNITLFPEKLQFTFLLTGIDNPLFTPDSRKIVWEEKNGNSWSLKMYNLDSALKIHLVSEAEAFPNKDAEILDKKMSETGNELYLTIKVDGTVREYSMQLDNIPAKLQEVETENSTGTVPVGLPSDSVTYISSGAYVYYLDEAGYVFRSSDFLSGKERLNDEPITISKDRTYKLLRLSDFLLIEEEQGALYVLKNDSKKFDRIFSPVKSLSVSPDGRKLLYFSDYEIGILFLEQINEQPQRAKGDNIFLIRLSEKIGDVYWLTPDYLVFNTPTGIKITEIDNRDSINVVQISEFPDSKIVWLPGKNKLYVLSNKGLWSTESILP